MVVMNSAGRIDLSGLSNCTIADLTLSDWDISCPSPWDPGLISRVDALGSLRELACGKGRRVFAAEVLSIKYKQSRKE